MTEEHKQRMLATGSDEHIEELGDCEGIVEGPVDYGTLQGPEAGMRYRASMFQCVWRRKYL